MRRLLNGVSVFHLVPIERPGEQLARRSQCRLQPGQVARPYCLCDQKLHKHRREKVGNRADGLAKEKTAPECRENKHAVQENCAPSARKAGRHLERRWQGTVPPPGESTRQARAVEKK